MTEAPSHLIRAGGGVIRVPRLHIDASGVWPLAYEVHPDEDMCRVCGCTNLFGCAGGCGWVDAQHTVCTRCFKRSMLP